MTARRLPHAPPVENLLGNPREFSAGRKLAENQQP